MHRPGAGRRRGMEAFDATSGTNSTATSITPPSGARAHDVARQLRTLSIPRLAVGRQPHPCGALWRNAAIYACFWLTIRSPDEPGRRAWVMEPPLYAVSWPMIMARI